MTTATTASGKRMTAPTTTTKGTRETMTTTRKRSIKSTSRGKDETTTTGTKGFASGIPSGLRQDPNRGFLGLWQRRQHCADSSGGTLRSYRPLSRLTSVTLVSLRHVKKPSTHEGRRSLVCSRCRRCFVQIVFFMKRKFGLSPRTVSADVISGRKN